MKAGWGESVDFVSLSVGLGVLSIDFAGYPPNLCGYQPGGIGACFHPSI